jgi:hypothetical protein
MAFAGLVLMRRQASRGRQWLAEPDHNVQRGR